jgi:hypothetical protein
MAPREKTPVLTDEERDRLAARAGVDIGETPTLSISPEKICFIVFKAREFDVKDAPSLSDDGSDSPDDEMRSVLEDRPDDPVVRELVGFIDALSFDEQVDLVTLMWMGRGDGTIADWYELRDTACNEHNDRTALYLLGTPLLADFLSEGLAQFGRSCQEFAAGI